MMIYILLSISMAYKYVELESKNFLSSFVNTNFLELKWLIWYSLYFCRISLTVKNSHQYQTKPRIHHKPKNAKYAIFILSDFAETSHGWWRRYTHIRMVLWFHKKLIERF